MDFMLPIGEYLQCMKGKKNFVMFKWKDSLSLHFYCLRHGAFPRGGMAIAE